MRVLPLAFLPKKISSSFLFFIDSNGMMMVYKEKNKKSWTKIAWRFSISGHLKIFLFLSLLMQSGHMCENLLFLTNFSKTGRNYGDFVSTNEKREEWDCCWGFSEHLFSLRVLSETENESGHPSSTFTYHWQMTKRCNDNRKLTAALLLRCAYSLHDVWCLSTTISSRLITLCSPLVFQQWQYNHVGNAWKRYQFGYWC